MSKLLPLHETAVATALEQQKEALNEISRQIWSHPETCYEEKFAHDLLTKFLESQKFQVTRGYLGVSTAFRAEFQSANYKKGLHATVAVLCEYDALPEIGHACGHNLIAEAGIGAGLAIQKMLMNQHGSNDAERVEGRVVLLGTPAEEGGGGKVDMVRNDALKDIDFAMMVHPFANNDLEPIILGIERCSVEFYGKAAHASCGPWEGVNALDAAVAAYHNIAIYRQQMKPNWRIHGVITNGGAKPNIIPDLTVSKYYVRAQTAVDLDFLKNKLIVMLNGAAKATGCTVKIEWEDKPYTGMLHSSTLSGLYKKYSAKDGVVFPEHAPGFYGSTDMGNVSIVVPSIHPGFFIGKPAMIHTKDFQELAGTPLAQGFTLTAAKSMALTAVELFVSKELRDQAKQEFDAKRKLFVG